MANVDRRRFLLTGAALANAGATASVLTHLLPPGIAEAQVSAPDLLYVPVHYGYRDHLVTGILGRRALRVYFPSPYAVDVPPNVATIRGGAHYPLVVFCHGQRGAFDGLCPADWTRDHRRWPRLLTLLARCGFIVVSPDMTDAHYQRENGALMIEQMVNWVRASSPYRTYVRQRAATDVIGDDRPRADPDVAVVGHSWGTYVIAELLRRQNLRPYCIGFTNGTWDSFENVATVRDSSVPVLLLCASRDHIVDASVYNTIRAFTPLRRFMFQAAMQRASHWSYSDVFDCDSSRPSRGSAAIASDLLVNFLHKYLYRRFQLSSSLQSAIGQRPPLSDWYKPSEGFALWVRWNDPLAAAGFGVRGERRRGTWTEARPW